MTQLSIVRERDTPVSIAVDEDSGTQPSASDHRLDVAELGVTGARLAGSGDPLESTPVVRVRRVAPTDRAGEDVPIATDGMSAVTHDQLRALARLSIAGASVVG